MMKLLVTGATGFIGKHVIRQALAEGHEVRASLRSLARSDEVRAAVGHGPLEFTELDLMSDTGWTGAMDGIDGLLHTASPVPVTGIRNDDDIVRPAVDGTVRAVGAARDAGVARVVVTSSISAILSGSDRPATHLFGPDDWTDPDGPGVSAYPRSKTLAERAARDIGAATPGMNLVTVNPGYVMGAPLDTHWASSLVLIDRLLTGRDPLMPQLSFPCIGVNDVAQAHLRALDLPDGARVVAAGKTMWMSEIASAVRAAVPEAKAARLTAPNWVVHVFARFNPAIRRFVSDLGSFKQMNSRTLVAALGRPLTPPEDAIAEAARALWAQRS